MSPRLSLLLATVAALLASGFTVRAEGAIISMSVPTSEAMATKSGAGGSEGDSSQQQEKREQLSESDFSFPADSTGTSAPSGGAPSGVAFAVLASGHELREPELVTRLAVAESLNLPDPPLLGLRRPPRIANA